MRARSREINIFNMSLLDILCGALGAFCFMMLVLLPYYKPPATEEDLRKERADTDELVKEMEKLKEATKDSAFAQQMQSLVDKLQEQIKQMQGQVNQYAAQNQQLQAANDSLTKTIQEQQRSLDQRRPFMTVVATNPSQDVNLYLWDDSLGGNKKASAPLFDPTQARQWPAWTGDTLSWLHGTSTWLVRDSPPNIHYKVYVKLTSDPVARATTAIDGVIVGENTKWVIDLPKVTLTPERFWTLLGTITGEAEGKASFKVATPEERDAEWTRLSKGATPPPAASVPARTLPIPPTSPSATGSPRPSGTAMTEQERKAWLEKMEQLRRQRQQQSPSAAQPTASP
jgi:hypothetical protein